MPTYLSTPQDEHGLPRSTGILVTNLGTPNAPTSKAVRRFLRDFLSDPRVVEYPRLIWWLVLNLVILVIRPPRSAKAYRKIWTEAGSPLLIHTREIADKLRQQFSADESVLVEFGMTYGEPSITTAINKLVDGGAQRIVTLPLFPQYSGTTTAAVFDAVTRELGAYRWVPESRFINSYHDEQGFITALANSVRESWQQHGRAEKLLMSFHGVPEYTLQNGDPYHCHCRKTARLLAEALQLAESDWLLAFQSRVGREKWLEPYTDATVRSLGAAGVETLDVVCPGFATDCLETLEEIAMQNAEYFVESGGKTLRYIPSLNSRDDHVGFLADLVRTHMLGWSPDTTVDLEMQQRAVAMGASR